MHRSLQCFQFFSILICHFINIWLYDRQEFLNRVKQNTDALFITATGSRISGNAIYYLIDKYSSEALGYHISPHKLRAGYCSIMYEKTHDIEFVRRAVGHSDVSTTQRYIVTPNKERKEATHIMNQLIL